MLIKPTRVKRVPRIKLGDHPYVNEPVILQCFPKCSRCLSRYPFTDVCYLKQFGFSFGILFFCCQCFQFVCMPSGKNDQCVCRYDHGLQLLFFIQSFRVIEVVNVFKGSLDFRFYIFEPLGIDFIPQNGMPGRTLFLKFGKNAGAIGIEPFWGHIGEYFFAYGLTEPERNHPVFVDVTRLVINRKRNFLPGINQVKILH